MRPSAFFNQEIMSTLQAFREGRLDRETAHLQLRHLALFDAEIIDALDAEEAARAEDQEGKV